MFARIAFWRAARHGLIVTAVTLVSTAAGPTSVGFAQDGPRWQSWDDEPGWRRARPDWRSQDDDDGDETDEEDRYDPDYESRRYVQPWRRQDGRSWRNKNGDDDDRPRRPNRRFYEDDDEWNTPDTPREDAGRDAATSADGGPRPVIAPAAPPIVAFRESYATGSIVIDTSARKLYHVTRPGRAYAYPIGVGREGFSWTGTEKVSRIADWPDWYPPAEMRRRKPELPERMSGGLFNPLGAKAIYLGTTLYRIHGTNEPKSIGRAESSGCFRMLNAHVLHLAARIEAGTQVAVVKSLGPAKVAVNGSPRPAVKPRPRAAGNFDDRDDGGFYPYDRPGDR